METRLAKDIIRKNIEGKGDDIRRKIYSILEKSKR